MGTAPSLGNGTIGVTLETPYICGYNYTSYDNTNLVIAIGGYYKIDYCSNAYFGAGVSCSSFSLRVDIPGVTNLTTNSIINPTNGVQIIPVSYVIGNSGIFHLAAGTTIQIAYQAAISAGTVALNNVSLNVVLLDAVSA